MENDARFKKGVVLLIMVSTAAIICGMSAIYKRNVMKGEIKKLFSTVIISQVQDGVPIDSIKKNLEKLKDIDSTGFTADVKIMDFIIKDYKRISLENRVTDSLNIKK